MDDWERISWLEAEPSAAARERERMAEVAPGLTWREGPSGGWEGTAPVWPFERERPAELDDFTEGRALHLRIEYPQSYPMVEPLFVPIEPEPPLVFRSWSQWHVLPNGGLCLLQEAASWNGSYSAADLVPKASGWFLEYLLVLKGLTAGMTVSGIVSDDHLDHFFMESRQRTDDER